MTSADWFRPGSSTVLAVFALVTMLALVTAVNSSAAAFGVYNTAWDGSSSLRSEVAEAGAEPVVALDTDRYESMTPAATVAIVLSPERPYTRAETARIRQFVESGGTLVVAEDFGPHGNDLLSAVGASARVDGRILRDERQFYRGPRMPVAGNVTGSVRTERLILNHGTVVRPNGAEMLVRASEFAYLDSNRNGYIEGTESVRSYPVVTVESVGAGRVFVVSDPSIFINAMLDRPGNEAFVQWLVAGHDRVVLDYSHGTSHPLLAVALHTVRTTPALQVVVGVVGTALIVSLLRLPDLWRGRSPEADGEASARDIDPVATVARLRQAHPDWTEWQIRRLADALSHTDDADE